LLERSQHQYPTHGDDRQRITRAREAAEALFQPKQQVTKPSGVEGSRSAEPPVREPRVLSISPPAHPEKAEAPINHEPEMPPAISASQVARMRTWVKYGMTVSQVAQVCGVPDGEIERLLRKN
jgi:hypothetical protein